MTAWEAKAEETSSNSGNRIVRVNSATERKSTSAPHALLYQNVTGRDGMIKPTKKQLHDAVAEWNEKVPVGAPVCYRKDTGEIIQTKTRSRAEMLSGHTPVVWLDGVRGCVALTHCSAQLSR